MKIYRQEQDYITSIITKREIKMDNIRMRENKDRIIMNYSRLTPYECQSHECSNTFNKIQKANKKLAQNLVERYLRENGYEGELLEVLLTDEAHSFSV